jgi:hypothetical protein
MRRVYVPLQDHFPAAMKFILLLIGVYLFYRYVLRQPKPLTHPQEPDLFIDHEEIKKAHEKNQ